MSGLVIDASVLAAWFFADEEDARIDEVIETVALGEACAPTFFYFEIRNALVINERRGRITPAKSAEYLRDLSHMRIRLEHPADDRALMTLARARKLTIYDAAYLDLALREGLALATLDGALKHAAIAEGVALFDA